MINSSSVLDHTSFSIEGSTTSIHTDIMIDWMDGVWTNNWSDWWLINDQMGV